MFKYSVKGSFWKSDHPSKKRGERKYCTYFTNSWKEAYKLAKKYNSIINRDN